MSLWWTVYQREEGHVVGRKTVHESGTTYEKKEYKLSFSHNPKRGIGDVLYIHADTAREAWDYCIEMGLNRSSGKWTRPRDGSNHPMLFISIEGTDVVSSSQTKYIHFRNGFFFSPNGLTKEMILELIELGKDGV